jgi:hypothetical protein
MIRQRASVMIARGPVGRLSCPKLIDPLSVVLVSVRMLVRGPVAAGATATDARPSRAQ